MILENIQKDSLAARKNRETDRATLLTTILSQVKNMAIDDGHRQPNDQDVIKVIRQFLKSVNENLELAAQGKMSADMATKYRAEKETLESYLPRQLGLDELKNIIGQSGAKNLGEAMKFLKEHHDGLYDGKLASAAAKEVLG